MMLRKLADRIGTGWIFLIVVILIYVFLAEVNYPLFERTLGVFGNIFWNIIPVIVLVFGIMFVTNFILTPERTVRYFGKGSGAKGWAVAIVGGILSTGPIYMWYPLLSDLKGRGMKDSLTAAFLYNRAVKIPLMPMMIFYFGWEFTVLLAVYMIIFSIISGVIVGKITGKKKEERGDQYEDSGSLAGEG